MFVNLTIICFKYDAPGTELSMYENIFDNGE